MVAKTSPFFEINYGWSLGEDNWNVGMDDNLKKLSAMLSKQLYGVGTTTPSLSDGQLFLNTSDKRLYYSVDNTVQSIIAPVGEFYLYNGEQYLWDGVQLTQKVFLETSQIGSTGSSLLASSTPAQGRGVLGLGTASTQPVSAFEPTIPTGGASQYITGAKTLADFPSTVRSTLLDGFTSAFSTPVMVDDTVISGLGKLQGQVLQKADSQSPSLLGIPTAPTAATGTSTTQIATTAFVINSIASGGSTVQNLSLSYKVASGTQGTSLTVGAYRQRPLNTIDRNSITGASLTGSVVTLPAGNYSVKAVAPAAAAGRLRLFDTANNLSLLIGNNSIASGTATLFGIISLANQTTVQLEHRMISTNNSSNALSFGDDEVHTILIFDKV